MDITLVLLCTLIIALLGLVIMRQQKLTPKKDDLQREQSMYMEFQNQFHQLREHMGNRVDGSSQLLQKQLSQMVDQLEQHRKLAFEGQNAVGKRLDNATKVVGEVQNKLGALETASQRIFDIGKEINSLSQILQAPKLRGNLGEFFLADLLGQILCKENYELQYRFKTGEAVDAIIKLQDWLVPVDAKFPLENFIKSIQAQDETEKKQYKKIFVNDVKKHINAIADKYIKPDEGTSDFALMYIPAENVYYEIIIKDELSSGEHVLYQHAMQKKVIPVSPNNLYIYLTTILMGLKGMNIERRAKDIMAQLGSLKLEFDKVEEAVAKMGKHLGNASSSYENLNQRLGKFNQKLDRLHQDGQKNAVLEEGDQYLLN